MAVHRLAIATVVALALGGGGAAARAASGEVAIGVVSNRADLVSGGDALVRVTLPRSVRPSTVRVTAAVATSPPRSPCVRTGGTRGS